MIGSTSKFEVSEILYMKDSFAIAKGYWDGDKSLCRLACRWYDPEGKGIGYPQTHGKPQWMVLPDHLEVNVLNTLQPENSKVSITF
jgi:hypothetical protein